MIDKTKRCCKCHLTLSFSSFYGNKSRYDGIASVCKVCKANSPGMKECVKAALRKRIDSNKRLLRLLKNKPCMDCGDVLNPWQMDFDHRPGTVKSFGIAMSTTMNPKVLIEETRKCDVVCSNCHRNRTYLRLHPEMIPHAVQL